MKKHIFVLLPILIFIFIPKNVFATDEVLNFRPESISYWTDTHNSITGNSSKFNFYNTDFYGYSYNASTTMTGVTFNFIEYPNANNKFGTINFSIYDGGLSNSYAKPYRVYIKDRDNNITTCYTDSTKVQTDSSLVSGTISPVICPSAFINGNFQIFIADYFRDVSGTIAISDVTFKINDDSSQSIIDNNNTNTDKIIDSNKETQETIKENTETQKETQETIKDKDTSESQQQASGFFNDFNNDDYGLSDIITMPLTFIQGLSNNTCNSLNIPLPFVNQNVELPCMTSIYQNYFGDFLNLYQTITTGFISYWVCINIFRLVQGFKNPDNDEIEVMEL